VRGIDIFQSDVNAIDRYQNPPGVLRHFSTLQKGPKP
jgi:hypothetical protein